MSVPRIDELEVVTRRLAERVRLLPLSRLAAPAPPHPSRARAVHALAQQLADLALGAEERRASRPPEWWTLPWLTDPAVGDQLAVTLTDAVTALRALGPDEQVWTRAGLRPAAAVVGEVLAEVRRTKDAVG